MPQIPPGKHAWSVKIGERGQIVLPKEARDLYDFQPGDTILLLGDDQMGIAIPPKPMMQALLGGVFDRMPEESK